MLNCRDVALPRLLFYVLLIALIINYFYLCGKRFNNLGFYLGYEEILACVDSLYGYEKTGGYCYHRR